MKKSFLCTIAAIGFASAIYTTPVKALTPTITLYPTYGKFELDNRPYLHDMKIVCRYDFQNAHGKKEYKTDTVDKHGVYVNTFLYARNSDCVSYKGQMTYFLDGERYGTIEKLY